MIYEGEPPENMIIKIVGLSNPNFKADIPEISLNSPLGKAIYGKKVQDQTFYIINETKVNVIIKGKAKTLEDLEKEIKK